MGTKTNTGRGFIASAEERTHDPLFERALKKLLNASDNEIRFYLRQEKRILAETDCLRLVPGAENLLLRALSGKRTIYESVDVFRLGRDEDFRNWGLNDSGRRTKKTKVSVYNMTVAASFHAIFKSLSSDFEDLCLTQDQIVEFCLVHPQHLRQEGYETFFLIKRDWTKAATKANLLVVRMFMYPVGLLADVIPLGFDGVLSSQSRYCMVVPQILVS